MSEKEINNSQSKKKSGARDEPPISILLVTETAAKNESYFSTTDAKRPNYGTNNTLELLERIPSQVVELKLDDVLDAVKTVDNLCDFPRCKAKTSLMGQDCLLCKKRFCFKHGLPEVHGCGEAAKKDERKKFLHPKPLKTIRQEEELAQAKKKLEAKLKNMQVSRRQKSGDSAKVGDYNSGGSKKKKAK